MVRRRILRPSIRALVPVLGLVALATPAVAGDIRPFLNCIRPLPDVGPAHLEAVFGYASSLTTAVTIPVGEQNFTSPGLIDRGQPTVFEPGVHDNVFSTRFQASGSQTSVSWFLDSGGGEAATATFDVRKACDAPRFRGTWGAENAYITNDLVTSDNALWLLAAGFSTAEPAVGFQPGVSSFWIPWQGLRLGLPPARPAAFASAQVFTFPRSGTVTITDPNVTPNSVIVLQYVGDRRSEPRLGTVGTGQFTAIGAFGRHFRYVVFP